jgi:phosphoribosylamine--glycine ligase
MKLMVLGSGGREHALAWRLSRDQNVEQVFVFPGNPGMLLDSEFPVKILGGEAIFETALRHALEQSIQLVVIGPEKYLYEGWVDQFQKNGIAAYGPTQAAAFLEESKIKSKQFMKEFQIPTAEFVSVQTLTQALHEIESHPHWDGYVLKLSGPALGKGVIVCQDQPSALKAAKDFFEHQPPGIEEGMVIEEFIAGQEVSLFYACLNESFQFLASASDHKRLLDGDLGPNTGGMGAYSPSDWFTPQQLKEAEEKFVVPTLKGMIAKGTPFQGTLFLGLMVNARGSYLLEYNTRFGDPETQTFLPLLTGNLSEVLFASASGNQQLFAQSQVQSAQSHSVHVVKAARGYPGLFGEEIERGHDIHLNLFRPTHGLQLFFAGVKKTNAGKLESSGGRVLGFTAVAPTQAQARKLVYQNLEMANFSGEQFRRDIGQEKGGVQK